MKKILISIFLVLILVTTVSADDLLVNRPFNVTCAAGNVNIMGEGLNWSKTCDFTTTTVDWSVKQTSFSSLITAMTYMANNCVSNASLSILYEKYPNCIIANEDYSKRINNLTNEYKDQYKECNQSLQNMQSTLDSCYREKSNSDNNYETCNKAKSVWTNQWWFHILIGAVLGFVAYYLWSKKRMEKTPPQMDMYSRR